MPLVNGLSAWESRCLDLILLGLTGEAGAEWVACVGCWLCQILGESHREAVVLQTVTDHLPSFSLGMLTAPEYLGLHAPREAREQT